MRNIQLISGKNFEKFILNLNRENAEEIYPSNSRLFHKLTSPSHKEEKWKGMSEDEHDLFPNFRGIIILGRFLGLVPCSGVFYKSSKDLNCRICSLSTLVSLLCILLLSFNAGLAIADAIKSSKDDVSVPVHRIIQNPLFACWGLYIYFYFLVRRKRFINIFKIWAEKTKNVTYSEEDTTLYRTIVIMSVILLSSTVAENAVLNLQYFQYFDEINGHNARYCKEWEMHPTFKMFYWRGFPYWNNVIGYHDLFIPLAFVAHKLVLYGWNFTDVFCALFFRAMYFKFKALYTTGKRHLVKGTYGESTTIFEESEKRSRQEWNQLAYDHYLLCEVLDALNQFFSPILFVSYTVNIYFFCMQFLEALNPETIHQSLVHSIYVPWSFIHIIVRVLLVTLCASKVNEYAHRITEIIMHCPKEYYEGPIVKLERRVNSGLKLGLTGLGCFVISRPFMLSIMQVVFTVEIVLLQGISTVPVPKCKHNN